MGDFTFHVGRGELKRGEETIKLTERERDLLRMFAQRPGHARSPATSWPATIPPAASAPSTCRSTGCAARSRATPPIPSTCKRCAARAISCTPTEAAPERGWRARPCSRARNCPKRWRKLAQPRATGRRAGLGAHSLRAVGELAPKGLYARALIIIIAPIVLLESVVAFTFMERHWNQVTRRLSEGTARDMAAIIDVYESQRHQRRHAKLVEMAQNRFGLSLPILPPGNLPTTQPKPFFDLLDRALSDEIRTQPQAAVLDRYGRPVAARRDPRQARQRHPALRRPAQPGLRLQLAHLPDLDGRHVGGAADGRDSVPAQPDPARSCGWPKPPTPSARAGPCRTTSGRAARARCGRPRRRSSRCATASATTSSSAPPCWPASATICAPC